MCKKTKYKIPNPRIDKCMQNLIFRMKQYGIKTIACCCGHNKYPMTILIKDIEESYDDWDGEDVAFVYDLISDIDTPLGEIDEMWMELE